MDVKQHWFEWIWDEKTIINAATCKSGCRILPLRVGVLYSVER